MGELPCGGFPFLFGVAALCVEGLVGQPGGVDGVLHLLAQDDVLAERLDGELLEMEDAFLHFQQQRLDQGRVALAYGLFDFDQAGHDFGGVHGELPFLRWS